MSKRRKKPRFEPAKVVPGSRRKWTAFHAPAACPKCKRPMTVRKNRVDGSTFAGCTGFPACTFTIAFPRLRAKAINDTS